jgi:hypothetical protein
MYGMIISQGQVTPKKKKERNTMIKYAVLTTTFEFDPKKYESVEAAVLDYGVENSKYDAFFDTIEEAREHLHNIKVRTDIFSYRLARARAALIEEAEFDYDEDTENWEFIAGSTYWDIACEELKKDDEV